MISKLIQQGYKPNPNTEAGRIDIFTVWFWKQVYRNHSYSAHLKRATLPKWREPVRLAVKEDGLSLTQLKDVVLFAMQDDFWKNKIMSTSGLRRNYYSCYGDMKLRMKKKQKAIPVQENAISYAYTDLSKYE